MNVRSEDFGLFYALLAKYHDDRESFVHAANELILNTEQGNVERSEKIYTKSPRAGRNSGGQSKALGLFAFVRAHCNCGTCYNTFARPSRTPWVPRGHGLFSSAEFGKITVTDCDVANYDGPPGYIYKSYTEYKNMAALREESAIRLVDLHTKQEQQEIAKQLRETRLLEKKTRLAGREARIRTDIAELQQERQDTNFRIESEIREEKQECSLKRQKEFNIVQQVRSIHPTTFNLRLRDIDEYLVGEQLLAGDMTADEIFELYQNPYYLSSGFEEALCTELEMIEERIVRENDLEMLDVKMMALEEQLESFTMESYIDIPLDEITNE